MLSFPPAKYRKRRKARPPQTQASTGPVLVAATYDAGMPSVTLTFDRAIDASAIVAGTVTVFDGNLSAVVNNTTDVTPDSPETVTVLCVPDGDFFGEGVTMTAVAGTGIVDDAGSPWAGVTDLSLPFPPLP